MTQLFTAITSISLMLFQGVNRSPQNYATLRVEGRTASGDRIEKVWAVLVPISRAGEERKTSGSVAEFSVPTGEYILRVEAPGFASRTQLVRVYQPQTFRTVALPLARVEGPEYPTLTGTIRNYEGDLKNLRIRLMALYGNELRESTVDAQGMFNVPADEGIYLLVVSGETEKGLALLHSRVLRLRLAAQEMITIDLKGNRGDLVQD